MPVTDAIDAGDKFVNELDTHLEVVDRDGLFVDLVTACGSDRVDLVDLDRAGGLVRYRVCRDGTPLYEQAPGTFQHFWLQAVRFWCDAEPVLRPGYDDVLHGLPRRRAPRRDVEP